MPAGCRKPQYLLHRAHYLGHLRLESNYPILNFLAHTYDAEVDHITHHKTPSKASTIPILLGRPTSTPDTVAYPTQGDPDQAAPRNEHIAKEFHGTNNYFIPDGTDHCIHDILDT